MELKRCRQNMRENRNKKYNVIYFTKREGKK